MTEVALSLVELGAIVAFAVGLAATDASAVSRLLVTAVAKRAGLEPGEIMRYGDAAEGDE